MKSSQTRQAPDFELTDSQGRKHTLGSFLERGPVLLVFLRHLA